MSVLDEVEECVGLTRFCVASNRTSGHNASRGMTVIQTDDPEPPRNDRLDRFVDVQCRSNCFTLQKILFCLYSALAPPDTVGAVKEFNVFR